MTAVLQKLLFHAILRKRLQGVKTMTTRAQLLQLLEAAQGRFLSGEEIAEKLGISRAAVCKAAKALRDQGFPIEAATRKGYCLQEEADILSQETVQALADSFWQIRVMDQVSSTNSLLRELALQGAPEGTVLIARSQSAGRGRMGRAFYSPRNSGLYLSLLLRPEDLPPHEGLRLTTMAASALCLAIEETTCLYPQIKWVNDLLLNGKKISGILTEASFSMETGQMDFIALGLGINLYTPKNGFPDALRDIAGALCQTPVQNLKNRLTAAFLKHFLYFYRDRRWEEAAQVYRNRSVLIGKEILVQKKKGPCSGCQRSVSTGGGI